MSSESESKVVVAGSWCKRYRVKEEGKEKLCLGTFSGNLLLVYYAIWKRMHPNISTCTGKETESL